MVKTAIITATLLTLLSAPAWALDDEGDLDPIFTVGVAGTPPFVEYNPKIDKYQGISIDLWESIAKEKGWNYNYKHYETTEGLLRATHKGMVNVGIGPNTITGIRYTQLEFTHPYYVTELAIMSPASGQSMTHKVKHFLSETFLYALVFLIGVLSLVGTIFWAVEARANDNIATGPLGILNGMWWAIVTMTTVGYGDISPMTRAGRLVASVWMVLAMLTVTSMTAGIASALTLAGLDEGVIENLDELKGKRIATVRGTTGQALSERLTSRVLLRADCKVAAMDVLTDTADAVIFDKPSLEHFMKKNPGLNLALVDAGVGVQSYGFVMPKKSLISRYLREALNDGIIRRVEDGRMDKIRKRWLGE